MTFAVPGQFPSFSFFLLFQQSIQVPHPFHLETLFESKYLLSVQQPQPSPTTLKPSSHFTLILPTKTVALLSEALVQTDTQL